MNVTKTIGVILVAGSEVTGIIAVVLLTSQGACSECHRDNRCGFSDVTWTIAVVSVTSQGCV